MSLEPGHKLAHYEILEPIGKGGMGEVFRARDGKLGRDVAIKVLPDEFSQDRERLDRFEREARLLAQLNHSNIATLHGLEESDGQKFLVMELVGGETLAERIAQGPIPIDEAIALFIQIAEGLEAAHEKGILHRDLKPANTMIGPDDKIKILDFGLAKAFVGEQAASDSSKSPTLTKGTALGAIMGTAAYMSPEQARGKPVDGRTDIWAMGVCLFEAVSGTKPFHGETVTDVLAAVVNKEPNWSSLPVVMPSGLRRLLEKSLTKKARDRIHHAADVRIELESIAREPATTSSAESKAHRANAPAATAIAIALVTTLVAAWSLMRSPAPLSVEITRTAVRLETGLSLRGSGISAAIAISPDGRHLAYIGSLPGASTHLYLRPIDALESHVVDGSEFAATPFFSPDSKWLGFTARGKLIKVAVSGGAPVTIADIQGVRGTSWAADGTLVFTPALSSGLWQLPADGGEPEVLTVPDRSRREKSHRYPQVLPGDEAVLFTVGSGDITTWDDASIEVLSLVTGERKLLIDGGTFGRYVDTGHIVYGRGGALLAVAFDLNTLEVRGSPVPVVDGVQVTTSGGNAEFGVTRNGALLYARQRSVVGSEVRWVGRDGVTISSMEGQPWLVALRPSPDGRYLAMWVEEANGTTFVHDIERGTSTRIVSGFDNHFPVWSPNGKRLAFRSNRDGTFNLYWQAADGSGEAERLTKTDHEQTPTSFSPDGELLAFDEFHPVSGSDIWILPIEGDQSPEPYLQTQFNEREAVFSPDGHFIAYQSNESSEVEVYIQGYPNSGRKWRVSSDGGTTPHWNPQGGELFYRDEQRMMVVDIDTQGDLSLGTPRTLFETSALFAEIMPDGQSFVTIELSEAASNFADQLILVQNWAEELKRLVPTN